MEVEEAGMAIRTVAGAPGAAAPSGPVEPIGRADWRGDVALELWVESDADAVRIRMAGRLDASTAANLNEVARELLADGTRHIELCTDGLRVIDASAVGALSDVERSVRRSGGTFLRLAPANGPFPRSHHGAPPRAPHR